MFITTRDRIFATVTFLTVRSLNCELRHSLHPTFHTQFSSTCHATSRRVCCVPCPPPLRPAAARARAIDGSIHATTSWLLPVGEPLLFSRACACRRLARTTRPSLIDAESCCCHPAHCVGSGARARRQASPAPSRAASRCASAQRPRRRP